MSMEDVVTINAKTGAVTYSKKNITKPPKPGNPKKGIDMDKLKQILLSKGVISDLSEVE